MVGYVRAKCLASFFLSEAFSAKSFLVICLIISYAFKLSGYLTKIPLYYVRDTVQPISYMGMNIATYTKWKQFLKLFFFFF